LAQRRQSIALKLEVWFEPMRSKKFLPMKTEFAPARAGKARNQQK
jgi:hypothetical protein